MKVAPVVEWKGSAPPSEMNANEMSSGDHRVCHPSRPPWGGGESKVMGYGIHHFRLREKQSINKASNCSDKIAWEIDDLVHNSLSISYMT